MVGGREVWRMGQTKGIVILLYIANLIFLVVLNCDRILENGSKSHMKSIVFQHVFNCIST